MKHLFPYRWRLSDGYPAKGIENHRSTVFGTFVCGGGSTMGYKLAGYHHLGGVEIDPKVAEVYRHNNHPENLYVEDLRLFNAREDLPAELYQLDLLDGSPPCSTFSTAGVREKGWNKEKQFAEGQALQRLDDLVFVYCDTIAKLRPKCFLLENVSGLIKDNAKSYVARIVKRLSDAGYTAQVFCLNAAKMGVPQMRQRVFIIGHRKELDLPPLRLEFSEPPVYFREVADMEDRSCTLTPLMQRYWAEAKPGQSVGKFKSIRKVDADGVCNTITTTAPMSPYFVRSLNDSEICRVSTFPEDYETLDNRPLVWFCGMSVPPVMTAQISYQIYKQWIEKI